MPKKSTNVFKRKDGRWEGRYVKGVSKDGKKMYASVYGRSFEEAKNKRDQQLTAHTQNIQSGLKLKDFMYEWLECNKLLLKKSTYQKYKSIIYNHIETHMISYIKVAEINNRTISAFSHQLLSSSGLCAKSINDVLVVLGMILKYAEEIYGFTKPRIRYLHVESKEMRVLSITEQHQLEEYLKNDINNYKLGILIALYTGIRIGELCALQWDDIFDGNIYINKTMQRLKGKNKTSVEINEPKTPKSIRIIPIPLFLTPLLEKNRSAGSVLKNKNGKAVEPRLMQITFEKYIADCGLPKTNFHALRHTFATRCVEAGFDIKTLSEILGHSDVKTTLNKYVHSSLNQKQKNMNLLKPAVDF